MSKFDSTCSKFSIFTFLCLVFLVEVNSVSLKVCTKEGCNQTADMFNAVMNRSADPCDNFYNYACGNFGAYTASKHKLSERYSWTSLLTENITARTKEFILSKTIGKSELSAAKKAHNFYQSCIDTDSMNDRGLAPIKDILQKIGLPITVPKGKVKKFNWVEAAANMKKYMNLDFLFSVKVTTLEPDSSNKSRTTFVFDRPPRALPFMENSYYSNDLNTLKLRTYARAIFEEISGDHNETKSKSYTRALDKIVDQLVDFSTSRKQLYKKEYSTKERTFQNRLKTIKELQLFTDIASQCATGSNTTSKKKQNSVIDWKKYLITLFDRIPNLKLDFKDEDNITVSSTGDGVTITNQIDKIMISDGVYFRKLISFLTMRTEKEIQLAMWFDVVTQYASITTNTMRNLTAAFRGKDYSTEKWNEECYSFVSSFFSLAVLQHIVSDKEATETKAEMRAFVHDYKSALAYIITNADWIDNTTKTAAIGKIKKMKNKISHPSWLLNDTALDHFYGEMEIVDKYFYKSIVKWQQNTVVKNLKLLNDNDIDPEEFSDEDIQEILTVNAFYSPSTNTIIIPMAILQVPNYGYPLRSLNYGAVGATIGHEITHGFDDSGIQYDADGEENSWFQTESWENYLNRTKCFAESYGSIPVGAGQLFDGEETLGENIADNGGMRQSILAYRHWVQDKKGEEQLLPGFEDLTPEQLVFLSYAISWCEYCPNEELKYVYEGDVHSPPELRVLGPLINSQEFAEAWKCPKGSRMNPDKAKCQIW